MHKYLKEAGFDKEYWADTLPRDDNRRSRWAKQRREYSMDERETWNLDCLSLTWLYEHIKMYLEFSDIDDVDLSLNTFVVRGKNLNQKEILDKILKTIELYFNVNNCFYENPENEYLKMYKNNMDAKAILCKEIWNLWGMVCQSMWW